jgi:two-component system sensor histidine kinase KdpD
VAAACRPCGTIPGVTANGKRGAAAGLLVAVASVAVITGAIYALREIVPVVSTGVVYMLAVLLVSSQWGLWMGLLTATLSAAAFNFFHIPPTGRFNIADEQNVVALVVFIVAAAVTSTLAGSARARAEEAERGRREADLAEELARVLLGGESVEGSLRTAGRRIARAFELRSVSVELGWVDSDERRRALPLIVEGSRIGTVLVPADTDPAVLDALQDRVIPGVETLVGAVRRRDELESQVIETKALRRSNVVKTAILRSVSHDLRTPLTAITAAAGGLDSETLSPEARRELVSVVVTESARLSRLVDNLLDLARLQAGPVESRHDTVDLEDVLRAALASVPPAPGGFDLRFDPDLPAINADAGQLERAFANVLENAVRYAGEESVSIRARSAAAGILVRISDRGPGIGRQDLELIFEPFHRTGDERGSGSGLGLAIARGFLEANGGRIRAESLPGQGTTFVIQIPASTAERSPS